MRLNRLLCSHPQSVRDGFVLLLPGNQPQRSSPSLPRYTPSPALDTVAPYVPNPETLDRAKAAVARRVRIVIALLRLIGRKREAHKLETGFRQWDEGNSTKNDILLWFRSVGRSSEGGSLDLFDDTAFKCTCHFGRLTLLPHTQKLSTCSSRGALSLESRLAPDQSSAFPVVWRGDWTLYSRAYINEVNHPGRGEPLSFP